MAQTEEPIETAAKDSTGRLLKVWEEETPIWYIGFWDGENWVNRDNLFQVLDPTHWADLPPMEITP